MQLVVLTWKISRIRLSLNFELWTKVSNKLNNIEISDVHILEDLDKKNFEFED